jgi:UDP-2,3-diacylglucosamine hydrolase
VAAYFVSDVHLRIDRPDRGCRFARLVESFAPEDTVVIVGDLCDFWFASRQRDADPLTCPGLRALAAFRSRGGSVTIMPGNHDLWLGPFYEQVLGVRFVQEPLELEAYGLRLHLVHGHLLGGRSVWKAVMEGRTFLHTFRLLPGAPARRLEKLLYLANEKRRAMSDERHIAAFRRYADGITHHVDLVVCGHIHTPRDDTSRRPRLVVLGGWLRGTSYLRIDESGAVAVVEPLPA